MSNLVVMTTLIIGFLFTLAFLGLLGFKLRQSLWNMHIRLNNLHNQNVECKAHIDKISTTLAISAKETQNAVYLSQLGLRIPIFLGGWCIDAFLGKLLVQLLVESRPKTILELGSGASTVLIARTLQIIGINDCTHIAVDHEKKYLELSYEYARLNGLADRVTWLECPLEQIESMHKLWYGGLTDQLEGKKIDFLIIDGPPGALQIHSRYPALPLLLPFLNEHCTVVLDDAIREEEQEIARRWVAENPEFTLELLLDGHGMAVLSR